MKKIFNIILLFLGFMVVFATVNAQEAKKPNTEIDSLFLTNTYALPHVYADPFMKTKIMIQDYNVLNDVWEWQRNQTKEMCIGFGFGAAGIAGLIKTSNMPTPIRQVNNPALDKQADKYRRNRQIWGGSSIVLGTVGAVILVRSFRWTKRINAEVGIQSLKLEYNLTGNRRYYKKRKHPKRLKSLGLYSNHNE